MVRDLVAFPDGLELTVVGHVRRPAARGRRGAPANADWWDAEDDEGHLRPEVLRLGLELPGGAQVTNLDLHWGGACDVVDLDYGLESLGGTGSDDRTTQQYWVWPLPVDGLLGIVCEWPAYGIPETRVDVDGRLIADAAARAEPLWTDEEGRPTHRTTRAAVQAFEARTPPARATPPPEPPT